MKKVILHINSEYEKHEIVLKDEITFGRTDLADMVLPDSGLSRLNTSIFRDGDNIFVVDENSTNGTFVNGKQVSEQPYKLNDRDEITIGTYTNIYVEIIDENSKPVEKKQEQVKETKKTQETKKNTVKKNDEESKLPIIPIVAALSVFVIIIGAVVALLIVNRQPKGGPNSNNITATVQSGALIPVYVIDPLGGQDPDDIDDLIAALNADIADDFGDNTSSLEDVQNNMEKTSSENSADLELIVRPELIAEMLGLAKAPRSPSGERPPGLNVRPELCCGVPKQTAKLEQMVRERGYTQPMDFGDLAERRLNGDLIELPAATQFYVLDVGGSANEAEFTEFTWENKSVTMPKDHPKYKTLQRLADNFGGQKYNLDDPKHRRQMKIRLLRMFNKKAKPILEEFAKKYQGRFKRPLRITSLTRSMEYQIALNGNNANSFKVRGDGSRPPHTSGCAFDLARKQMTVEEQNFMIETLAEMENRGVLDALIEYNANACFHIFIYDDGTPPRTGGGKK